MELGSLNALVLSDAVRDRAYADALIRLRYGRAKGHERSRLRDLHAMLGARAQRLHEPARRQLASGAWRGARLADLIESTPALERDHFVEELLGIAYPPLEEEALERDLMGYMPSTFDEIATALRVTRLGPQHHFVDLGSGMGKAVLLAALLTGARATGVELSASLHRASARAADVLGLPRVAFCQGDARQVMVDDADVVFMYLPFSGDALHAVLARVLSAPRPSGGRQLCAGALDLQRYPSLRLVSRGPAWLNVYRLD